MTDVEKKEEMKRFEEETGKQAIWHGEITESFKNWKDNKKIYGKDKKGIGLLVSEDVKTQWKNFAKEKDITLTKFIIESVNFYANYLSKTSKYRDFIDISHSLKEPLTAIQGFTHLLLENNENSLDPSVLAKIQEIYSYSLDLEEKINEIFCPVETTKSDYDILIIDDDPATISILNSYLRIKGITCKGVTSGNKGLREIEQSFPKLILLDIILPDIDGFEMCKKLKSIEKYRKIPIYFITAIPEERVNNRLEETGADGYFLKPFKFEKLDKLFENF